MVVALLIVGFWLADVQVPGPAQAQVEIGGVPPVDPPPRLMAAPAQMVIVAGLTVAVGLSQTVTVTVAAVAEVQVPSLTVRL